MKVIFYYACYLLRGCMPNAWLEQIPHYLLRSNHSFPLFTEMANTRERKWEKEMRMGNQEK